MANWKKVVVSGSSAALSEVLLDTALSTSMGGTGLTTTELTAATAGQVLSLNAGKTGFEFKDDSAPDGVLSSSAQIASEISGAFGAPSASFSTRVTNLEDGGGLPDGVLSSSAQIATEISGAFGAASASFSTRVTANETAITTLNGAGLLSSSAQIASEISGAFGAPSASFSTRVTNLEAGGGLPDGVLSSSAQIASDISGSSGNKLPLAGGTMEGAIVMGNQDITGVKDLVVNRNFSVAGTASFNHSTNLSVADKYILLNSGSKGSEDSGGIVIQDGATQNVGDLFGFDAEANRWSVTSSFNADTSANFVPDAFMSITISGSASDPDGAPLKYHKAGNIFAAEDGTIYIYGNK